MRKRSMIVLAAMGVSLVACGSSDGGGDGVASLGTTDGTVSRVGGRHGRRRRCGARGPGGSSRRRWICSSSAWRTMASKCPEGVVVSRDGDESDRRRRRCPVVFTARMTADGRHAAGGRRRSTEGAGPPPDRRGGDRGGQRGVPWPSRERRPAVRPDARTGGGDGGRPARVQPVHGGAGCRTAGDDGGRRRHRCARRGVRGGRGRCSAAPIDPEEMEAASKVCQKVYDQYPELDDVFGEGGMAGPAIRVVRSGRAVRRLALVGAAVLATGVSGAGALTMTSASGGAAATGEDRPTTDRTPPSCHARSDQPRRRCLVRHCRGQPGRSGLGGGLLGDARFR